MNSQLARYMLLNASSDHCAFAAHEIHSLGGEAGQTFGEGWPWYEILIRPRKSVYAGSPAAFVDQLYRDRPPEVTDIEIVERAVRWLNRREQRTRVSINTHPESLTSRAFVNMVLAQNRSAAALGHSICLELVEYGDCKDRLLLVNNARHLRAEGVTIALDDFGSRLNCFDLCAAGIVDVVKIDTSVINQLHQDRNQRAIVESIRTLGDGLGAQVVAEGVETVDELRVLRKIGIDFAQGYYFHKPEIVEI